MKNLYLFLLVIVTLINYAHSEDTINVPEGTSPIIDGTISSEEWSDAYAITYQAGFSGNIITVTCYLKHNGTDTLYIAQNMPNTLSGDRNLVWLDTYNNGGASPQTDDYMLNKYHCDGSPTIEEKGTGSSWNMVAQNGWAIALTGYDWSSNTGQIEITVAFSKLGIKTGIKKTIGFGIAFGELTYPYNPSKIWSWPTNSDYMNPNSWGDLVFFNNQSNINDQEKDKNISIFPNPNNGIFTIKGEIDKSIEIINEIGQIVFRKQYIGNNNQHVIDIGNQANGIYFVKILTNKKLIIEKLIVTVP